MSAFVVNQNEKFGLPTTLVVEVCYKCGMAFAMPECVNHRLREKNRGESFYCPAGHGQHYLGKRESERQRERAESAERDLAWMRSQRETVERQLIAQRGQTTKVRNALKKIERRTAAGVCPCCNRTFKQLARHMACKHPDFQKEHLG